MKIEHRVEIERRDQVVLVWDIGNKRFIIERWHSWGREVTHSAANVTEAAAAFDAATKPR